MRITGNLDKFIILMSVCWFIIFSGIQIIVLVFMYTICIENPEDTFTIFLFFLIPNGLLYLLNYKLWGFISEYINLAIKEFKTNRAIKNPLPYNYKAILNEKFAYYNRLDAQTKRRFEKKVYHFILSKKFIPTHDLKEPTIEMKVLIAASAAQLTLGFPNVYLTSFTNIVLYATDYINPFTRKRHQGEVNPKGSIVLSWNNFVQGYAIPTNALNLGLHEMAHALKFENFSEDKEYLFIDAKYFHYWDKVAKPIFYQIQSGEQTFLRTYAGSNSEEFFAVCVEYFFEKPHEFNAMLP